MIVPLCRGIQRTEPNLFQNESLGETSSNETNKFNLNETTILYTILYTIVLTQIEVTRETEMDD